MAQEVGLQSVVQQIGESIQAGNLPLTEQLLWPALDQFPQVPQLWYHAGNHLFSMGKITLASLAFEKAIEIEPNAVCLANLGAAYRQLNRPQDALRSSDVCSSDLLAACFINEGMPETGLKYANKALAMQPDFDRARWNAALCHLEMGNFRKGFELYESGLGNDRIDRKYGDAQYLTDPLHENARGRGERLIVYGEQGIGDELMFASMLYDVQKDYDLVWDHHPRLGSFYEAEFEFELHPTRKEDPEKLDWDTRAPYRISIADLAKWYRPSRNSFTRAWKDHGPFWRADPELTEQYRVGLEAQAEGRKIVGISTRGGVLKTNRFYRSVAVEHIEPLLEDERLFFVNIDYEDLEAMVVHVNSKWPNKMAYFRSINHHFNYKHTAALIAATDAFVTVCQSAAHLSAGMGHPTAVLTPKRPAWRYGLTAKRWYWYPGKQIQLFRAPEDGAWETPMGEISKWLELTEDRRRRHA